MILTFDLRVSVLLRGQWTGPTRPIDHEVDEK